MATNPDELRETIRVLEANNWNVSDTARALGINRKTLYRDRLRAVDLGLIPPDKLNLQTLSEEELLETLEVYRKTGNNYTATGRALGISHSSARDRVRKASELGLTDRTPVMPGFRISKVSSNLDGDGNLKSESIQQVPDAGEGEDFVLPKGQIIDRLSTLVQDGKVVQQWVKSKTDANGIDWVELLKDAFAEYEGRAEPVPAPEYANHDYLNLIPANDFHLNLLCWSREVGQNWDLKIAEKVIGNSITTAIKRTRDAGTAVVLGGGDLMHADDNTNRTAKSGNVLDADGRHLKGIEAAQRLKVRIIETALEHNEKVIVRILQGNHDEYSSVAIAHFLSAWFRNEPRVSVDLDGSLFWWLRFGKVMLAATHGHTVKLAQMPSIMAHRRAEDWGATKFRYAHGFHIHHHSKIATEGEGVICESHQAPIPQDNWHYNSGYLSGRSVQTITYHRDYGEVGRAREAIIDAVTDDFRWSA